jgi:hypothetical protein
MTALVRNVKVFAGPPSSSDPNCLFGAFSTSGKFRIWDSRPGCAAAKFGLSQLSMDVV